MSAARFLLHFFLLVISVLNASSNLSPCTSNPEIAVAKGLEVDGTGRCYAEYKPPNLSSPAPVLLFFHGRGDAQSTQYCASPYNWYGNFGQQAVEKGFILICGAAAAENNNEWTFPDAVIGNGNNNCARSASTDNAYFRELLNALSQDPAVDMSRIYLAGYSQGSAFSAYAAYCFSDSVVAFSQGGLGLYAGGGNPPSYFWPVKPVVTNPPIKDCIYHGTADEVVDVATAYAMADRLEAIGMPYELEIYEGLAHSPPSGWAGLLTACMGIDGTRSTAPSPVPTPPSPVAPTPDDPSLDPTLPDCSRGARNVCMKRKFKIARCDNCKASWVCSDVNERRCQIALCTKEAKVPNLEAKKWQRC